MEVDFRIEWAQSHPQLIQPSHKMPIVLYVVQYILFQSQHGALSRLTKTTQKPKPEVATDQNRKCDISQNWVGFEATIVFSRIANLFPKWAIEPFPVNAKAILKK